LLLLDLQVIVLYKLLKPVVTEDFTMHLQISQCLSLYSWFVARYLGGIQHHDCVYLWTKTNLKLYYSGVGGTKRKEENVGMDPWDVFGGLITVK